MADPNQEPVAEILAELDELGYVPGTVTGERRDPSLQWVPVMGMGNAPLGALCRAMGEASSRYLRQEQREHLVPMIDFGTATDKDLARHRRDLERSHDQMTTLRLFAAEKITEMITYSGIESEYPALYSKTAIFRAHEPVLYFEHWGTEDLDEPESDPVEIQMFVGLNHYTKTGVGIVTASGVLRELVGDSGMSRTMVPDRLKTFGTINPQLFEPFVRPAEAE
jgi:hypothetical protein